MHSPWKWCWPTINVALRVDATAASIFEGARQHWYQRERGGQLFADLADPVGIHLIATPPHSTDRSGHTWLELNEKRCRIEIVDANAKGLRLIGYWHTHPQKVPRLSPKDLASLRAFSARHRDVLPNPVAIIVGTSKTSQGIRAWSMRPDGPIEGLHEIDDEPQ